MYLGRYIDMRIFKRSLFKYVIIPVTSFILIYLLGSFYFANHLFFNTVINGVDVSLKAYDEVSGLMKNFVDGYELQLIERNGVTENIKAQNMGMSYNEKSSISEIYSMQNSFQWIVSLFKKQKYYVNDLFLYRDEDFENVINTLICLNCEPIKPQNVSFKYSNGSYQMVKEIKGNQIIPEKLIKAIKITVLSGKTMLDLDKAHCYENPRYTLSSDKALKTRDLLNKYVSTNIIYKLGNGSEKIDGNTINKWLIVDENLGVRISEVEVRKYVDGLSKKYDTVGTARMFKTSVGKIVEVKGGLYGWKMNRDGEVKALMEDISIGRVMEKEPLYIQKALAEGDDEIGSTYVEINITKQYLWFYKEGSLIAQNSVVTGNPNKGNATVTGINMLNYKQKGATLTGPGYESEVMYWMPFYGNIGIHDAGWRYSFGGEIYKTNGTHGCVNVPLSLAATIFENIESGIPIICYEE